MYTYVYIYVYIYIHIHIYIYISQNLWYKPCRDLQICCLKELEFVFIELMIPDKQSYIIGTIC